MLYDFIIIGSGIAGLTAALEAHKALPKKSNILLITKNRLEDSNTNYAQGGIAAVFSPSDNYKKHVEDTLNAGQHHNNSKTVEMIVKEAPQAVKKLQQLGVPFNQTNKGTLELHLEGGHQENRIVNVNDSTGHAIQMALMKKLSKKITVLENAFAKDLLVKKGVCYGVAVIHKQKIENFYAKRTVLAAGGIGQLYAKTTNPFGATGDGIAMAIRAGCKVKDLEFIQFHPTALDDGTSPLFLLSETLRGDGAKLLNTKGEYFMPRYHQLTDLAPRDIVSRAIYSEQKRGKVFLDLRNIPAKTLQSKYPAIYKTLRAKGFDPHKKPIPVTPAAHYLCGGVLTNNYGETNVKNLYAIGEVACTGLHGANRLASNSLLEGAVMGTKVGLKKLPSKIDQPNFPLTKYKSQKLNILIKKSIQKIMWQNLGIIRNKTAMGKALTQLIKISARLPASACTDKNSSELNNMLITAVAITKAALARKKSLGTHWVD